VKVLAVSVLVLAAATTALAGGWWVAGGDVGCRGRSVDEAEYVRANEAVLRELQLYPSAPLVNSYSIGQTASDSCIPFAENGPPYEGFTTTWIYRLPPGATRTEVIDFYDKQVLDDWDQAIVRRGSHNCEVSYTRGPAILYISACSSEGMLTITVDHDAVA